MNAISFVYWSLTDKFYCVFKLVDEPLHVTVPISSTTAQGTSSQGGQKAGSSQQTDAGPIRAPAPMWRCSKIMHLQRELHPTILNSLEGIVDQVGKTGRKEWLKDTRVKFNDIILETVSFSLHSILYHFKFLLILMTGRTLYQ